MSLDPAAYAVELKSHDPARVRRALDSTSAAVANAPNPSFGHDEGFCYTPQLYFAWELLGRPSAQVRECLLAVLDHPTMDINARREDGTTLLIGCCWYDAKATMCSMLMGRPELDVNAQNAAAHQHSYTPLLTAAYKGNVLWVGALLERPELLLLLPNVRSETAYDLATVAFSHPRVAGQLRAETERRGAAWVAAVAAVVEGAAAPRLPSKTAWSGPLSLWHPPANVDTTEAIRAAAAAASPDVVNAFYHAWDNQTALQWAVGRRDFPLAHALLALVPGGGLDANARSGDGATALVAAAVGDVDAPSMVSLLLETGGADPLVGGRPETALEAATRLQHVGVIETLLRAGAVPSAFAGTAAGLGEAARRNQLAVWERAVLSRDLGAVEAALAASSTDVVNAHFRAFNTDDELDGDPAAPLMALGYAVMCGDLDLMALLLRSDKVGVNNAVPSGQDKGATPVCGAAWYHADRGAVDLLLAHPRTLVNVQSTERKYGPLASACYRGHLGALRALLECDEVDLSVRNVRGESAADTAEAFGHRVCSYAVRRETARRARVERARGLSVAFELVRRGRAEATDATAALVGAHGMFPLDQRSLGLEPLIGGILLWAAGDAWAADAEMEAMVEDAALVRDPGSSGAAEAAAA